MKYYICVIHNIKKEVIYCNSPNKPKLEKYLDSVADFR